MDEKRQMKAREIDDEGYWQADGIEIQLLGKLLPIPVEVRFYPDQDTEEVLFLTDAEQHFEECPGSGCGAPVQGIVLFTEFARMFPTHCCNTILWFSVRDERRDYFSWSKQYL